MLITQLRTRAESRPYPCIDCASDLSINNQQSEIWNQQFRLRRRFQSMKAEPRPNRMHVPGSGIVV